MALKDPNCPNCGGRSYNVCTPDPEYYLCPYCEEPDEVFIAWHKGLQKKAARFRQINERGRLRVALDSFKAYLRWLWS